MQQEPGTDNQIAPAPRQTAQQAVPYDAGAEELKQSFSAFKDRLQQGHEMKALRRELARHREALKGMRAVYEDNCDILAHFDDVVGAQRDIVEGNGRIVESTRASMERIAADVLAQEARLEELRDAHALALRPQAEELYLRNTELSNAHNVVHACDKKLKAARKAARQEGASAAEGQRYLEAQGDLDEAKARLEEARSRQRTAQREHDAKAKGFKIEEDGVCDEVKRLGKERERLAREVDELERKSDAARQRIAYCEEVAAHPDQTERLRSDIDAAVLEENEMNAQIEELFDAHSISKGSSKLARNIVAALIGIVVFLLVGTLLAYLFL